MGFLIKQTYNMSKNIICNMKRIITLALFEYKLMTKGYVLGGFWKIASPFIQIGVYWLVFGMGIRSGRPIDGLPYLPWLTCGLSAWFIINACISQSSNSIYSKATILTRSNIPTYIIPISKVLGVFFDGCWTIVLMLIICISYGVDIGINALGLIYYMLCIVILSSVISLCTSALVLVARDFQKIIQMVMRLLFFLSPIFWQPGDDMPKAFLWFDMYNPIAYIIRGLRECVLYNSSILQTTEMLIFWAEIVAFYLLGALLQGKLRGNLLDYL